MSQSAISLVAELFYYEGFTEMSQKHCH